MIPRSALRDTITINKRLETGAAGPYGDPTLVTTSTPNVPAIVWPSGTPDELEIQRDTRINIYNVIVDPNADVNGISEIVWNGLTLEVLGEPFLFMARGKPHHYEIKARDIRG